MITTLADEARPTSLSALSRHGWVMLSNRWAQGIDFIVYRVGKKWAVIEPFGAFPLFRTKREAYEAATRLLLAESHYRALKGGDNG